MKLRIPEVFETFYRHENEVEAIRGTLYGGAIGDALGAPFEFLDLAGIESFYGYIEPEDLPHITGTTLYVTDDTQMTLFTLEGLLRASLMETDDPIDVIYQSYVSWLYTQGEEIDIIPLEKVLQSWLVRKKVMHRRAGPGRTCISALKSGRAGTPDQPLNDSKGCGTIMRVAPVGLMNLENPFEMGVRVGALTHGHPSGYLAGGFFAQVLHDMMGGKSLAESIEHAYTLLIEWEGHEEIIQALERAFSALSECSDEPGAIERVGLGWVAEEALALALYAVGCARSFLHGIYVAVFHSGDSDSVGELTAQLLGMKYGFSNLPVGLVERLDVHEVMDKLIRDFLRVRIGEFGNENDRKHYMIPD